MTVLMTRIFLTLLCALMTSLAHGQGIKIIVHETSSVSNLSRDEVRAFFLKKKKQWPDGTQVRFFDRNTDSPERKTFLSDVINRSQRQVETYWIGQKLYTGHSAPTQLSSDLMMASLVSRFPGSIGYVSKDFTGAKGIKEIELKGD